MRYRSVGTERFRRRRAECATVALSEGRGAGPRNAVWCCSVATETDADARTIPGLREVGVWPAKVARSLRCVVGRRDAPGISALIYADGAIMRFGVISA